ncbi:hypothetical protein [Lysinibacter sp. HNR]|uniref:hypothetical protein n=1 Tax=Lysinibacter sp. HNR TaxID=3031408 RepID=UPI002434F501|nr:hypothetical protein [Lysinibacter sp. HNR]WGD37920.1 hypothetical protein FrondiHNR_03120 [Lysinibacter sp. HNR]
MNRQSAHRYHKRSSHKNHIPRANPPHKDHTPRHTRRPPRVQRHAKICAGILAIAGLLPATISTTLAAFTDTSTFGVGTAGAIGGRYDIALIDRDGNVTQGDNPAYVVDTSNVGLINTIGSPRTATFDLSVVTLTEASGPVTLQLFNAYTGVRPPDPGYPTGADPYNVALFTVSVNGTPVRTALTAAQINAQPVILNNWRQNIPQTVTVSINMPGALGNPYFFNRTLALGINFNGSTS